MFASCRFPTATAVHWSCQAIFHARQISFGLTTRWCLRRLVRESALSRQRRPVISFVCPCAPMPLWRPDTDQSILPLGCMSIWCLAAPGVTARRGAIAIKEATQHPVWYREQQAQAVGTRSFPSSDESAPMAVSVCRTMGTLAGGLHTKLHRNDDTDSGSDDCQNNSLSTMAASEIDQGGRGGVKNRSRDTCLVGIIDVVNSRDHGPVLSPLPANTIGSELLCQSRRVAPSLLSHA